MKSHAISRFIRYQLPALLWALAIFVSSSLSGRLFGGLHLWQYDKLVHFILYLVLGLFVYRALELFWSEKKFSFSRGFSTIVLVTLYGGIDEIHQRFVPGRSADVMDAVSDLAGGLAAVLLIAVIGVFRPESR